jgi:DNA-binding MarR family transcriptional regulator
MATARNPAAEALTGLVLSTFRANGLLVAWGDRFAAAEGLTSARWQMLGAIALAPAPLTAPEIASYMGVSRQGAQKQLDRLVEEGLVERSPNPQHARSPLHALSERGRAAYDRVDRRWNQRAAALAEACRPNDVHAGHRALSTLMAELAQDLEKS